MRVQRGSEWADRSAMQSSELLKSRWSWLTHRLIIHVLGIFLNSQVHWSSSVSNSGKSMESKGVSGLGMATAKLWHGHSSGTVA